MEIYILCVTASFMSLAGLGNGLLSFEITTFLSLWLLFFPVYLHVRAVASIIVMLFCLWQCKGQGGQQAKCYGAGYLVMKLTPLWVSSPTCILFPRHLRNLSLWVSQTSQLCTGTCIECLFHLKGPMGILY